MQSSGLVAPTQKISDDAPYPPSSIPPQNYIPSSVPPQNYSSGPATLPPPSSVPPPASIPPQNNSYPPQNNAYPTPNNPKSIPPQNAVPRVQTAPPVAPSGPVSTPQATPSQPRTRSNGVPSVSRRQTPAFSDPSITAPPRKRWGLILFVLVLDLALAGAGVYLLTEGLA